MDYSSVDKRSSEQLFLQIRRMMLRAIREQELQPRQRVPSVNELSAHLGVSRMTVRQALQALIEEGWLYTVPGKGTFVAERPHIEQNLQTLKGWTEEIRAQGMHPSTRLISVDTIAADRGIARHLNIPTGSAVTRIARVRYADDFPLSFERAYLVQARFPEIGEMMRQESVSLYSILRTVYGVNPTRAVQFIEAGEADQYTAGLLDLMPGSPVLLSERITYGDGNDPLEYVCGMTRPGFVRYKTELNATSSSMTTIILPLENAPDAGRGA